MRTARRQLVAGIDPGAVRPAATAAWSVLSLEPATAIGVVQPAASLIKSALPAFITEHPVFAESALRMVCLAAPLTPVLLVKKPSKARAVEIRLSRGTFVASCMGPSMPSIANSLSWPRYVQAVPLRGALEQRGFPLLTLPESPPVELPRRCMAEVFPKASLAVLAPREHKETKQRPAAHQAFGQLDDWLFPRLLLPSEAAAPSPFAAWLHGVEPSLHLAPETLQEVRRIAGLRRPVPRREPLRAFVAALQGILALQAAACLVGCPGGHEGALLLPISSHPDWEAEWCVDRGVSIRRIPVVGTTHVWTPGPGRRGVA